MKIFFYIKFFLIVILIQPDSSNVILHAQENQFTQIYSVSPYINPAFTGDAHNMRAHLSLRLFSPIPGESFTNTFFSIDQKLRNQRSAFGLTAYHQNQSINHLKVQLNYSYTVDLNRTWSAKGGLGISFNQRKSQVNDFTYPDQYTDFGFSGNPTREPSLNEESTYPAINAGALIYSDHFWFGFAADHINQPKENFAGSEQMVPLKFGIHGGYTFFIYENKSSRRRFSKFGGLEPYKTAGPIFSIVKQGSFTYTNFGVILQWSPVFSSIHFNSVRQEVSGKEGSAYNGLGIALGFRREEIAVSYLYEAALQKSSINRNGAHEISLIYFFTTSKEDYKRVRLTPLPNQLIY